MKRLLKTLFAIVTIGLLLSGFGIGAIVLTPATRSAMPSSRSTTTRSRCRA